MASPLSTSTIPQDTDEGALVQEPLVMQIVVRKDLLEQQGWGLGPLMAQAAHAATAVLHETRSRPDTIEYLASLRSMHKVVLETSDQDSLLKVSSLLSSLPIPHHLWTEQPEDTPTCLALAPNRKDKSVKKALNKGHCRLWR